MPLFNGYYYPIIQKQEIQKDKTNVLASGSTKQFISGENLETGNVIYSKNNKVFKADAENLSSSIPTGITLESQTTGNLINVLIGYGNTTFDFNNLISGKRYFLGKTGSIVETPIYSNIIQIGIASSENEFVYSPFFIIQK